MWQGLEGLAEPVMERKRNNEAEAETWKAWFWLASLPSQAKATRNINLEI